jgi:hypothetical protein
MSCLNNKLNFNRLVMHYRRIVQYSLLVLFIVSGCAGMDDFLEVTLEQEPLVLFHCDAYQANSDTLVLIGIKTPDIYNGIQSTTLRFYLKNDNDALSIIHGSSKDVSTFLPFARIDTRTAVNFDRDFPELKELRVFGLYLQGMKVDEKKLELYKTLQDGSYRNISMRNAQMVNDREVFFISREVDKKQSRFYKKLVANTFSLKR